VIGEPIYKKFLNNNYLVAVEFREGWIFGRVIRRKVCQYKPYKVIDSSGSDVVVSASSASNEYRFRDPRNTKVDVLHLETATDRGLFWIMHGAIGIEPEYIRMYVRIPEGQAWVGKFPSVDPIRPDQGDNIGYITSNESPYENPTDFLELVIPPMVHISAMYYNTDSSKSYQPVLNLLFCIYWLQLFSVDKHAKLISSIATRKIPAAFLTAGFADVPLSAPSSVVSEWKEMGVRPMSLDKASSLG